MRARDRLFVGHMLAAAERIVELAERTQVEDFAKDWVIQDALMRELGVLGEAAGRVSGTLASSHPEIPWREITGIRHKLIHDYFEVDLQVVWRTATENVPAVLPAIRGLLESIPE